jgi:hypothetical protein
VIDTILRTQSDLDALRADCSVVQGNIDIVCSDVDPIKTLEVFRLVEEITGYFRIEKCKYLTSLEPGSLHTL